MVWFPIEQSARFLADEAELLSLTDTSRACSLEDLKSALVQEAAEDDQAEDVEPQEITYDEAVDNQIADVGIEFQKRVSAIGDGYPFNFDGAVLTASDSWAKEAAAYVFLLLLSAQGLSGQRNGPRLFEEVVTVALRKYLDGSSLRFGFPYRSPVPSHPDKAVDYIAQQIGQPRLRTRNVRASEKDMGVDVVAWKPFSDGRQTELVLLANCSTGANWSSKLGELNIGKWKRMIDFGCDPVRVFAVPWIPSSEDWENIVDHGNLVLDRVRAASLLAGWDAIDTIRNWCSKRLKEVRTS